MLEMDDESRQAPCADTSFRLGTTERAWVSECCIRGEGSLEVVQLFLRDPEADPPPG